MADRAALYPNRSRLDAPGIAAVFRSGFRYTVIGFVVFISLAPVIWLVISSFQTNEEILSSALHLPKSPSLAGYRSAIEIADLHWKFVTSILVGSITTVLSVTIYAMAAYVLARTRFALRNPIFTILVGSILIPVNTMVQPVYQVVRSLGLYDTRAALILVYTGFAMPVALFLLRSFMLHLPRALEESAYLEGAGFARTFFSIVLPLTKPALTSAAVLTFLASWHELLYALMLTSSEENRTLSLAMRYFVQSFTFDYSAMFAALVLYIVPSVTIYVILQDSITKGMVAGALKE